MAPRESAKMAVATRATVRNGLRLPAGMLKDDLVVSNDVRADLSQPVKPQATNDRA
jgi:hypothetical protein